MAKRKVRSTAAKEKPDQKHSIRDCPLCGARLSDQRKEHLLRILQRADQIFLFDDEKERALIEEERKMEAQWLDAQRRTRARSPN
jgi:hypothetical protein